MGVIRNFIDIEGIIHKEDLPHNFYDHMIIYSDTENIFISEQKNSMKNIFQIFIDLKVKAFKVIEMPLCKVLIIDGIKKLKIIYSQKNDENKAGILELQRPFNTCIELSQGLEEFENIDIYILDAYFELINENTIYSYIVYFVNINSRYKKTKEEIVFYNENKQIEMLNDYKQKELEKAMDGLKSSNNKFYIKKIELGKAKMEYKDKNEVLY